MSKKQHTSMIVGKTLPTPKPQRGGALQTKARRLLRMGPQDAKPVVIDLLQDMDKVTLQDLAAKKFEQYRKLADKELNDATVMRTLTGDDLLHGDPEPNKLRAWLSIIALGKKVPPRGRGEIGYKSALQNPNNLSFSEDFGRKHPNVKRSFERFAA